MPTARKQVRMATTGTQTPAPPTVAAEHAEQNLGPPKRRAMHTSVAEEPEQAKEEEASAAEESKKEAINKKIRDKV